ncbi:MAG: cob(I)yrinic acid a,c-diamide adenosyltransferase [Thiogranum sp.]|nr:cob(I)yrinic acid a,c-diamide adenosyltransferase [Thiogranum sp.]
MGHRLSKIVTRTGDRGETGLGDGSRVPKDHLRIEAIGSVDELNSVIGILIAGAPADTVQDTLHAVQHKLFDVGGELSIPGHSMLKDDDITALESTIEELNAELPMLKEFILPGGCLSAAHCHHARTVCRRAERRLVALAAQQPVSPLCLQYLNRLSDLLFILARILNRIEHHDDVLWQRD